MNSIKILTISFLSFFMTSCASEEAAFKKKLIYDLRLGFDRYIVVPAKVNNQQKELCLSNWEIQYFARIDGKRIPDSVVLILIKKAIDKRFVFEIADSTEQTKDYEYNDSMYKHLQAIGLQGVKNKYVDSLRNFINKDSAGSELKFSNIVRYFYFQNHLISSGGYSGLPYVIPPPHKIPRRAIRKLFYIPF